MEITIASNYDEMSKISAQIIAEEIRKKHNLVLGLATGDTPIGTYKELVRIHKEEGLDFSKVKSFNLDEYLSLAPLHKNSYNYFMYENLVKHININPENVTRGEWLITVSVVCICNLILNWKPGRIFLSGLKTHLILPAMIYTALEWYGVNNCLMILLFFVLGSELNIINTVSVLQFSYNIKDIYDERWW